jgi:hypothetical protein
MSELDENERVISHPISSAVNPATRHGIFIRPVIIETLCEERMANSRHLLVPVTAMTQDQNYRRAEWES